MAEKDIDGFFTTARVAAREEAVELPGGDYRDFLLDHDDPKLTEVRGLSYDEFTEDRYQAPFLQELLPTGAPSTTSRSWASPRTGSCAKGFTNYQKWWTSIPNHCARPSAC